MRRYVDGSAVRRRPDRIHVGEAPDVDRSYHRRCRRRRCRRRSRPRRRCRIHETSPGIAMSQAWLVFTCATWTGDGGDGGGGGDDNGGGVSSASVCL